ncbi:MAG: DNA-binding protein [Firmicutes bacterium]|nr:DNA-binding protein [Bacillota bacterium]
MKVSEIDNMAYESLLYDFYGGLLTEKQREVMELYHEENFSIVEIARELKVSKQAIYDNLRKSDKILREYEAKLGLMMSLLKTRELVESIERKIDELSKSPELPKEGELREGLLEIRDMISELGE